MSSYHIRLLHSTPVYDEVSEHTFSVNGTGELALTWAVDEQCQTDSAVIEYCLLVDGVIYGDE
jgi:hypothetical protein